MPFNSHYTLIENWMPRKPEIGSGPEVSVSGIYQPESGPYHGCGLLALKKPPVGPSSDRSAKRIAAAAPSGIV